jgi:hypothetical protein
MSEKIKKALIILEEAYSSFDLLGSELKKQYEIDKAQESWIKVGGYFTVGFKKATSSEKFKSLENCDENLELHNG